MSKPTRKTAFDFLRKHRIAVVATSNEKNELSTSPIAYVVTNDERIRFVTKDDTTKYQNIFRTGQIALSVVDAEDPIAVNVSSGVRIVEDSDQAHETIRAIGKLTKNEDLLPVAKRMTGEFVVLEVYPGNLQYTDYRDVHDIGGDYIFEL